MRKLIFVIVFLCVLRLASSDISYVLSEYSVMNTGLASRGMIGSSVGILCNPSVVSFSRNFELSLQGVYMSYDRFGGVVSSSVGIYRLTGVDIAGGVGVSAFFGGVNNIEIIDENAISLGTTTSLDYGLGLSYATSLAGLFEFPFDVGLSLKYFSSSLRNISGSGIGLDFGFVLNPIKSLPDLGVSVSFINLFSSKTWSTGITEMVPVRLSLGVFYYLLDDSLVISLGADNTSMYSEIFSFRWMNVELGAGFALNPNFFVRVYGTVGNEFSINLGLNYDIVGFSRIGVLGWLDGIGFNSIGTVEFSTGSPRYLAKVIDPEVQKRKEIERTKYLEREYFSKAMIYFSDRDYKNAKKYLEEVLKINPDNDTARAMIRKIDDILALEEE